MKNDQIILTFLMLLIICSCTDTYVQSRMNEVRYGKAIIVEKTYLPSTYVSGLSYGTGNGSIGIVSGSTPEKYVLVFQCEWDAVFTIEDKDLWGKCAKGDTIDFEYVVVMNKIRNRKTNDVTYEQARVLLRRKVNGIEYHANW